MTKLFEPQRQAVEKLNRVLQEGNIAGNWSKTGTGKTLMSLELARSLQMQPLVVAPLAAHATWRQWSSSLEVPVLDIINCEKLRTGKTPWVKINGTGKKASFEWTLDSDKHIVIWDEVHRGLTGKDTITGKMAAMLRPQGIKTLMASATPFNSPLNARTLGYLFRLHNWTSASFFSWCRAHGCRPSPFHMGLEFPVQSKSAQAHLNRINGAIRDRCVMLTTDDLGAYFPDGCLVEPCLVQLSSRDEKEAARIYAEMDTEIRKKDHDNPMVAMLRARQRCELLKVPAMVDMVEDLIEEGMSVFVSVNFCDTVDKFLKELVGRGINKAVPLVGKMNQKQRELSVNMFNADMAQVLIASPAGGESISLHQKTADMRPRTSLISPGYSASQLIQALGRIKRAGMVAPVVQRIVLCANTVEQRVAARLEAKANAIETLVDSDLE
jgi:superfamily II DNA or RNA helicase